MSNPYLAPSADLSAPVSTDGSYKPKLFESKGRIGRLRYIAYSFVASVLAVIPLAILGALLATTTSSLIVSIVLYIPMIAITLIITRRRLHDLGHSGWLSVLMIIPFVNFLFGLYLIFARGADGPNAYGPAPAANSRLVIVAALVVPLFVVLLGILAAIAIPAYQSYVERARAADAAADSKL